jgi:hypothetical protein
MATPAATRDQSPTDGIPVAGYEPPSDAVNETAAGRRRAANPRTRRHGIGTQALGKTLGDIFLDREVDDPLGLDHVARHRTNGAKAVGETQANTLLPVHIRPLNISGVSFSRSPRPAGRLR